MSELRVILSDLDDTLFDHHRATRMALAVVREHEPALARWTLDTLDTRHRELLERLHLDVLSGRLNIEDARVSRFRELLVAAESGDAESGARAIAPIYREAYEQSWHAVPGAIELLRLVKAAGLQVIVVTNNNVLEQQLKLDRVGLHALIDGLVTSEETGCCKPAPAIFECALDRAGAAAEQAVMIGDAWAADIEGALQAGIRPVWLNRFAQTSRDASVAEIRSLTPEADAFAVLRGRIRT
jgi:putative hydrolase of the HAD superfamily